MAFSVKHLAFLFLIFLFSSIQIHARESKFFSKFNHYQTTTIGSNNIPNTTTGSSNATTVNPTATVNDKNGSNKSELSQEEDFLVKQDEDPSFTPQTTNGYGLYGHGSTQDSSTTDEIQGDTFGDLPEKTSTQEYTRGSYEDKEANTGYRGDNNGNYGYKAKQFGTSNTRLMDNSNVNSYNGYEKQYYNDNINNDNYNNNNNGYEAMQDSLSDTTFSAQGNNEYKTRDFSMSNSRFMDNGINNNNGYDTKQYGTRGIGKDDNLSRGKQQGLSDTRYMENGRYFQGDDNLSKGKQQGLSDTRFMENGKYFYNVNNENSYLNEYHPAVNRNYDGYRSSSQGVSSRNNYNYGNNNEKNEFNSSMEESRYPDGEKQEEFQP